MKSIINFLKESKDKKDKTDAKTLERGNIKFTIWKGPNEKAKWINDNEKYQKIEYCYVDNEKDIKIDFLLGFKDDSWQLWTGKPGSCSYDDDPYINFHTSKFAVAVVNALDEVQKMLDNVREDPVKWVQYYIHR